MTQHTRKPLPKSDAQLSTPKLSLLIIVHNSPEFSLTGRVGAFPPIYSGTHAFRSLERPTRSNRSSGKELARLDGISSKRLTWTRSSRKSHFSKCRHNVVDVATYIRRLEVKVLFVLRPLKIVTVTARCEMYANIAARILCVMCVISPIHLLKRGHG